MLDPMHVCIPVFPQLHPDWTLCEYNAYHAVRKDRLEAHYASCPERTMEKDLKEKFPR